VWCEQSDEYGGDTYDAYCDWGNAMVKGYTGYYVCNLLAICFMVKYMICMMAVIMDRDGGSRMMLMCKGVMIAILSTLGFALWWGMTGAAYDADCEWEDVASDIKDGDMPKMCAGTGATMSIVAFAITLMAGVLAAGVGFMTKDPVSVGYSQDVPCCCGPRCHQVIIKILLLIAVALSILSMAIRFWVHFEVEDNVYDGTFNGGLFSVRNFDYDPNIELDAYGWDCLAINPCDADDDTTACKTFEPLYKSGRIYLQMQFANLLCLFCVLATLFNAIFFKKDISHPMLNHALPHLAWIIHLVCIIVWATVGEVKFEMGSCDNDDTDADEKYDVCISLGPVLAIIQLIVQMVAAVWYTLVYHKRGAAEATAPETKQ
jgi:hypothetical protein